MQKALSILAALATVAVLAANSTFAAPAAGAPTGKQLRVKAKPAVKPARATSKKRTISNADGAVRASQKQGLEQQKKKIQTQIGKLQKDINQKQSLRKKEAAAAQDARKALAASNQKLEKLSSETAKTRTALVGIRQESGRIAGQLAKTRNDISTTAKLRYLHARKNNWQSMMSGISPTSVSRNKALLAYLAASHQEKVISLENSQGQLQSEEKQKSLQEKKLTTATANEKASNQQIVAGKQQHEKNTMQLDAQIEKQRQQVEELLRDQQRLSSLIQQINIAIAAQEKARRAQLERERLAQRRKAEEARRKAAQDAQGKKPVSRAAQPAEPAKEPLPAILENDFAKLRGRLPMPVSGRIAASYGQSRNGVGTWQGLMIRAPLNSPVKAVADGAVVYSGNLRGYGNLIILEHGDGYLSVYAYNNSLFKTNGSKVKAGDIIARVGPGENGNEPGLYFEIRSKGKPVNPRPWLR